MTTKAIVVRGHRLEVVRPDLFTLRRMLKKVGFLQRKLSLNPTEAQAISIAAEIDPVGAEMLQQCLRSWTSPEGFDLLTGRAPEAVRAAIVAVPGFAGEVLREATRTGPPPPADMR